MPKTSGVIGREIGRNRASVHQKICRMRREEGEDRWPQPTRLDPAAKPEPATTFKAKPLPYGARTLPLLPSELAQLQEDGPAARDYSSAASASRTRCRTSVRAAGTYPPSGSSHHVRDMCPGLQRQDCRDPT